MTTTSLTLTTAAAAGIRADALIVGVFAGDEGPVVQEPAQDLPTAAEFAAAADLAGITGDAGEAATVPAGELAAAKRLVFVGLGSAQAINADAVREAAGVAARSVAGLGTVASLLGSIDLSAAAEGHLLGGYVFDAYKKPAKAPVRIIRLVVPSAAKPAKQLLRSAQITAEAVGLARDLINTSPVDLPPAAFADRAKSAAHAAGLRVEVLDEKAMARGGYGGVLAVGSGSARPPRLVRISYRPTRPRAKVALVGKGITFDSGGLSIKPAQGMEHMTSDMSGAACVVAAVIGAAAMELPVSVTATVPMAENLPSGSSYRPGDVISHYAPRGQRAKTSHILNTDAEGRLVLADAIVRACQDKPDYLLETATLTGAQVVALGERTMGVMGSPELRDRVAELARECGEDGWAMPLPDHIRKELDSPLADIQNIGAGRAGGMLVAGHYLAEFVADGVQWAHLDVAGPAYNTGRARGYTPQGGTGVPVRTLLATIADIAAR